MVLLGRIELPTSALPRMRSTTELQQHTIPIVPHAADRAGRGALLVCAPRFVKRGLSLAGYSGNALTMGKDESGPSREARLAAKLRENLRRRKEQAREMAGNDNAGLPKPPPSH